MASRACIAVVCMVAQVQLLGGHEVAPTTAAVCPNSEQCMPQLCAMVSHSA